MLTDLLITIYLYVIHFKRWIVQKCVLLELFSVFTSTGWCMHNAGNPMITNAIRCGTDSDGTPIFIGRALHEGNMVPAKVMPDKNAAYISFNGVEVAKSDVELLQSGGVSWQPCTNGEVPFGAMVAGETAGGEQLYYGRCWHEGSQTPGKVQPSHGCLYIPYGGAEISVTEYEVLVIQDDGHHHHHHMPHERPTLF